MLKFQSLSVILVILLGPTNRTAYTFGKCILSMLQNQGKTPGCCVIPSGNAPHPHPHSAKACGPHATRWWDTHPTSWPGTLGTHLKLTFGPEWVLYYEHVIFAWIFFLSFRSKERRKSVEMNLCKPNTVPKVRGLTVFKCPCRAPLYVKQRSRQLSGDFAPHVKLRRFRINPVLLRKKKLFWKHPGGCEGTHREARMKNLNRTEWQRQQNNFVAKATKQFPTMYTSKLHTFCVRLLFKAKADRM